MLAIDGEELKADEDPYRLLRNKADRPVTLTVNATPSMVRRADRLLPAAHRAKRTCSISTG